MWILVFMIYFGKWVMNLIAEQMNSGKYNIVWKGEDMTGNAVASERVYLVMMKFGGAVQTRKIKLIK